jgi:hypothetical protein
MPEFKDFSDLDNEAFFVAFVQEHYERGWPHVAAASHSQVKANHELIKLAFETYGLNIKQYTVALSSKNPNHYKRAGALLHALYKHPIAEVTWGEELERLKDPDAVGVSYDDAQFWNNFTAYYDEHCNSMMAFDLAFRCCDVYEPTRKTYSKDFLDNMCYYMATNTNINVGSFVMILTAFWA